MPKWTTETSDPQDVAVLLFPRFSNLCLANAIEPLRAANDLLARDAYRWRFVTLDGGPVTSSSGLPVSPHGRLRDYGGGSFLFVMSSYQVRDFATPMTSRALQAAAGAFETIVGLDTGAWLMAKAELLDNRPATIHWDELTAFSETFPTIDTLADRVVFDGDRITCGGATTAFDLVLELIRRRHGAGLGLEVASLFLHQLADPPEPPLIRFHTSAVVERSVALMSANLETPIPISDIADQIGLTQRSLSRVFQAELGVPPAKVYKRIKLAAARRFAQTSTFTVAEIAVRCGYRNAAAMTRAFVAEFGVPPTALRKRA